MIYIISGTDRADSRSLVLAKQLLSFYKLNKAEAKVLDLQKLPLHTLHNLSYNQEAINKELKITFDSVAKAKALHIVCPEYNGSYPGILKFFIDYCKFPETFEGKCLAFVGLGGRFAGLRPVEHLMQMFSYHRAILYPDRVFVSDVWNSVKDQRLVDDNVSELLSKQVKSFIEFIKTQD